MTSRRSSCSIVGNGPAVVEGGTAQIGRAAKAATVSGSMPPPSSSAAGSVDSELSATVVVVSSTSGASVVVLDERKAGGGQYYKQSADRSVLDAQQSEGATLLAEARECGAELIGSAEIWGAFDGPLFLAEKDGGALVIRPKTAIVATGAYERPVMVPGWTLPGVMTTGAAQTLWRSYRTLPGKRVAIFGSGPLNAQVALELAKGGAEVALVGERAPRVWRAPMAALGAALADPALMLKGGAMLRDLRQHGVPLRYGAELSRITQTEGALRVEFRDGQGQAQDVVVNAVCMNAGFEPQNEILRLLGAEMVYDKAFGHLRCSRGSDMQTSVPNVFAVGDCAGLGGAPAARVEGTIAGRKAAALAGHGDGYDLFADERKLRRHRRFQRHLWRLYDVSPKPIEAVPRDMVVCRCEEISLGEVLDGMDTDPGHAGSLKRATRVGMGRCQGRYCGPVVARMVAQATGKEINDLSYFAPRVPIKPVAISAILAAENALGDQN